MNLPIVSELKPVTLIGGGEVTPDTLTEALTHAPFLVACDGGAKFALDNNVMPRTVIGDMDSITAETKAQIDPSKLHFIPDQDTTDFEKALLECKAPLFLGVGFLGGRLDHQLAAMTALVTFDSHAIVLIGQEDIVFLSPNTLKLELKLGTRVSLFPMGEVSGTSKGLRWAIDPIAFSPNGRIGTSNEAIGDVVLTFDKREMLVILPRACLSLVIDALYTAP